MLVLIQIVYVPKAQTGSSCPGLWEIAKNVQVKTLKFENTLNGIKTSVDLVTLLIMSVMCLFIYPMYILTYLEMM